MSSIPELQIHTVYSEKDAPVERAPSMRLRAMALLTIVVSACWLYATWVPVWGWIEREVMIGTGVLSALGTEPLLPPQVGIQGDGQEREKRSLSGAQKQAQANELAARHRQGKEAATRLVVTTVGWLAMTSFTGLWLTMAGFAGLLPGRAWRLAGLLFALVILVGTGVLIWYVNEEYAWLESILPSWVKPGIAALVFGLAAMTGLALNRRRVGLLRIGGFIVLFSAVFSVAAIWATLRWGGIPSDQMATMNYAKVFAIQSAYGWLLLLGTIRLRS